MSSAGVPGGSGSGASAVSHSQEYFCYQCDRTVTINPSPTSDLLCPNCNGGFLEEYENPTPTPNPIPNPNPFFPFASDTGGFPLVFSSTTTTGGDIQNPNDIASLIFPNLQHRLPGGNPFGEPDEFNPFVFLQNYIQTIRDHGANVQLVFENSPNTDPSGLRLPGNLGDYFVGPGFEQLIQQLAENDPNRYGTPPASKSAIESLPNIKVGPQLLASDSSQCAVCKDTFDLGADAKQMPCRHIYHSDCILPWLELHNSCPVCRYELPTDDPDYENVARTRGTSLPPDPTADSGAGAARQNQQETPRTLERRFRISLPWPFRQGERGSPAETSNSGNERESSSGDGSNRNLGSETRQEDLD